MRKIAFLLILVAALSIVGASAFTTANADRSVSIDVNTDTNGVLQFATGSAEGATINNGELVVNADNEVLTQNADFDFGDTASPSTSSAFTITNADGQSHTVTVSYTGAAEVTFYAVGPGGTVSTIGDGGSASFSLASGDVVYVSYSVSTPATSSATTLTGTVNVTAN